MALNGIIYNNPFIYRLFEWFKVIHLFVLRGHVISPSVRMRLAASFIRGASVIDLCCGPCQLRDYLPPGCQYTGVDASEGFKSYAEKRGICFIKVEDLFCKPELPHCDCLVVIISLYQFHPYVVSMLKYFQKNSERVIIVEDTTSVATKKNARVTLLRRIYDYLIGHGAKNHVTLHANEVRSFLSSSGFQTISEHNNYVVGIWDRCVSMKEGNYCNEQFELS